ncbi:MAG: ABC transporter ATP-binding protein [Oligoflexia bacterium]|nr:ABC transporter ATP-binding protein [Oligoflexia bacterium]
MTDLVVCSHVSKLFGQGALQVRALDDLSLTVERGEFTALVGPSGSGKTTLLNLIGGLDQASSGSISVGGIRIDQLGRGDLAELRLKKMGFIFQSYNLIPVLSAQENVEFVLELQGMANRERRAKSLDILAQVGLAGLEQRRPSELSGGQQQRVAVARAVVTEPELILADEPTANLDSATAVNLLDLMRHMNQDHGVTFIFSTHDARVMEYARRIVRLRDGRIESDERCDK